MTLSAFILVAIGSFGQAAILDFKPLAIESKPQDVLRIRGFEGDVKIVSSKGNQVTVRVKQDTTEGVGGILKQTMDEWNFSAQRNEGSVDLVIQSPQSAEVWRTILRSGGAPKFTLEISAPSLSVDMSWRNGKITVENYSANLHLNLQGGQALINGGNGDAKVYSQEAEIRIKGRSGRVVAEAYNAKINIEDIKGPVEVDNFSGETVMQRIEGHIEFKSYKAPLTLSASKGVLEFDTVRGAIKVTGLAGNFKGRTDEAPISAKLTSASEVRVTSQSGPVQLELPGSGASLSLASVEGPISGPNYLKVEQGTGQRFLRGRMSGGDEGSVIVRSQTGPIKVR